MTGMGGTGDWCVGLGTYDWDGWDWGLMFGMGGTGDWDGWDWGLMTGMCGTGDWCLGWVGLGTDDWDGKDSWLMTGMGGTGDWWLGRVGPMTGIGRTDDWWLEWVRLCTYQESNWQLVNGLDWWCNDSWLNGKYCIGVRLPCREVTMILETWALQGPTSNNAGILLRGSYFSINHTLIFGG